MVCINGMIFTSRQKIFPCKCKKCQKLNEMKWKKPLTIKRFITVLITIVLLFLFYTLNKQRNIYCTEVIEPYNPFKVLNISNSSNRLNIEQRFHDIQLRYLIKKVTLEEEKVYLRQKYAYELLRNDNRFLEWKSQWDQLTNSTHLIALPSIFQPNTNFMYTVFMIYNTTIFLIIPIILLVSSRISSSYKTTINKNNETCSQYKQLYEKIFDNFVSFSLIIEAISSTTLVQRHITYNSYDSKFLPQIRSKVNQNLLNTPHIQTKEVVKAQTLICAYLMRIKLPKYLKHTLYSMLPDVRKIIFDLNNYFFSKGSLDAMVLTTRMGQMIAQACTVETEYLQLPEFQSSQIICMKKITTSQLGSINTLERLQKLHEICYNEYQLNLWKNYLMYFPANMEIDLGLNKEISYNSCSFDLEIRIRRKLVTYNLQQSIDPETNQNTELIEKDKTIRSHTPFLRKAIKERFYLFVEIENQHLVCYKEILKIPFSSNIFTINIHIPIPLNINSINFCIYLISGCYLGCEYCMKKTIKLLYA
ncbi:translocation protein, putative [Entamoeba histolytica HM-3:IMSS]|uniref:Translocation protein, putative n=1 Tax=Entamoeba histolytica HM-3:IMSS TaxID=885315 RepID=M7WHI1_ENTHI|nr:translocation protein, putative [Entamoeba histolytica HM-3:IMSS]